MKTQQELEALMQGYKRGVAGRYRTLVAEEISDLPPGSYWVSPKVDGQLWFATSQGGTVTLQARNGRILEDAPLLDELRKRWGSSLDDTVIAGELFALSSGKERPRVGDVGKALGSDGDASRLGFLAFDLLVDEGAAPPEDYGERYAKLTSLLDGGKRAKAIKTDDVPHTQVQSLYDSYVGSGKAEGLVARGRDGRIYKIKPVLHLDCAVIGFTRRQEDPTLARSLLVGLERPDGTMQIVGSCGNLGSVTDRAKILAALEPLAVQGSSFRKASSSGAMYQLCRPAHVIEIMVSDVQAEDSAGNVIRQWAIRFDEATGWTGIAPVGGVTLIHPRWARSRDDKQATGVDVRMAQLDERCPTPGVDQAAEATVLPESTVLRREVYVKASKGKQMVRKLLVWCTNKHETDPRYPAYVVHCTDYSPTRKAPLKREVRLAPREDVAMSIADEWITKNIKRGWKPPA